MNSKKQTYLYLKNSVPDKLRATRKEERRCTERKGGLLSNDLVSSLTPLSPIFLHLNLRTRKEE